MLVKSRWMVTVVGGCSLGLLLSACTGVIVPPDQTQEGSGSDGAGGPPHGGGTDGPGSECTTTTPMASARHARLLTPSQYDNAVEDLVKVGGEPAKAFAAGAAAQLDDAAVELRANAAADIARQAAASLTAWAPCTPPAVTEAACRDQIIDTVGAHAFRHPLAPAERTQLVALFDAGMNEKDFATGVEWFLTGVLQSPDFLYEFARVAPGETAGEVRQLSAHEVASRLSFFLWDSIPDAELHAAAASDSLLEPTALLSTIERMMADQRFERGVRAFYTSWLRLGGLRELARDDPGFTTDVVNSLGASILMSAADLYASAAPNIESLFAGETYFMDDTLRSFYGLGQTGEGFSAVSLPGEGRRGILTHPALMARFARPAESSPIARGLFVLHSLMCRDMPPPPDGVAIPPLASEDTGLTTRERLEQHVSQAACAGCHTHFDPLGFAFENFDEVGRYRTSDAGKPVDSSGTVSSGVDIDGPFANGAELLDRIAKSADVKACFARHYFEFALSRGEAHEDACSLEAVKETFVPSGDLKALAVSVASSDSFRYRLSEGAAP